MKSLLPLTLFLLGPLMAPDEHRTPYPFQVPRPAQLLQRPKFQTLPPFQIFRILPLNQQPRRPKWDNSTSSDKPLRLA